MDTLKIRQARAADADVVPLINKHFELMRASSPEESCHVMEPDALDREGATVLVAELAGKVVAVGAWKEIADSHAELKSMHTDQAARGRGIARALLHALVASAQSQGMARISLETGTADLFAPARTLYEREGFQACPPFADYVEDPLSTFMTRTL